MKIFALTICAFVCVFIIGCTQQTDTTLVKGNYMGQEPPGLKPVIFAPGFISTDGSELNPMFTPDLKEFYFSTHDGEKYIIKHTKQVNGVWVKPVTVSFSGVYSDVDISVSYDGRKLFFGSDRPLTPNGNRAAGKNIWMIERYKENLGKPVLLRNGINRGNSQVFPCSAKNGNLYFQSGRPGNIDTSSADIYMAEWKNGKYLEPINLGENINSKYQEGDILIAPDESWIIVSVVDTPEGYGSGDFYISFRDDDGLWQKRILMGEEINTEYVETTPYLSPDGKYLFFTSKRTFVPHKADIYWVDIEIIEKYRSQFIKE